MRICADEHISPKILRAVRDLALPRSWLLCGVAELSLGGAEDEYWVSAFAESGGSGILSGDRRMLKRQTLIHALKRTGLVAVFLPPEWAEAKRHYQAAHILFWWPKVQAVFENAGKGTVWIVPKGFGDHELRAHAEKEGKGAGTATA